MEGVHLQNGFSRVQENGRIATELMVRDIRGADYWGCGGDIGEITNHLDTSPGSGYDESILPTSGKGIEGDNDVTSETISTVSVKDNTDTLTLRGAGSLAGVKVTTPYMPTTAAVIHINTGSSLALGDIILISDCKEADLFSNTQNNTPTSGNIAHNTGTISVGIENATKNLSHTYGGDAQILTPYAKIYFIGVNGSGSHSLYRADDGVANELVRGINDLQIMYGVDTSGNGSANTFKEAPTAAEMDQVLSVRVTLTSESGESSSGTPLERTYQTTANIRNRTL
jgi:type IV pilus assembly protein PilW